MLFSEQFIYKELEVNYELKRSTVYNNVVSKPKQYCTRVFYFCPQFKNKVSLKNILNVDFLFDENISVCLHDIPGIGAKLNYPLKCHNGFQGQIIVCV